MAMVETRLALVDVAAAAAELPPEDVLGVFVNVAEMATVESRLELVDAAAAAAELPPEDGLGVFVKAALDGAPVFSTP
jgi:uncharacterized ParB-like nuclease family protein